MRSYPQKSCRATEHRQASCTSIADAGHRVNVAYACTRVLRSRLCSTARRFSSSLLGSLRRFNGRPFSTALTMLSASTLKAHTGANNLETAVLLGCGPGACMSKLWQGSRRTATKSGSNQQAVQQCFMLSSSGC